MKHQNHKKRKIRKQVLQSLVLTLTILILLEGSLGILEMTNSLPEPYEWGSRQIISWKINECRKLFSQPEHKNKIKVVIVGDSKPQVSFDPHFMDNYFNNITISYNLGFRGIGMRMYSILIQDLIIPKISPDLLVWELNTHDFVDENFTNRDENFSLTSPMGRYYYQYTEGLDFEGLLEYYLLKYSRIYRYRSIILPSFLYFDSVTLSDIKTYEETYDRGFLRRWGKYNGSQPLKIRNMTIQRKFLEEGESLFFQTKNAIEAHNISLLIVHGAYRHLKVTYPRFDAILNTLNFDNFLDLNGNETFLDNGLYSPDGKHLNHLGAKVYTSFVCKKLTKWMHVPINSKK